MISCFRKVKLIDSSVCRPYVFMIIYLGLSSSASASATPVPPLAIYAAPPNWKETNVFNESKSNESPRVFGIPFSIALNFP